MKNNIVSIKYDRNDCYVPTFRVQTVSKDVKELIEDIIHDKYNKKLFDRLNVDERRTVRKIVRALKLDLPVDNEEDEKFQKNFEILKGEFLSGNSNPKMKDELKKYVVTAMSEGQIPRHEAYMLLFQLSL